MKNSIKIETRLCQEEQDLAKCCILYECSGDYVRGWVAALKWVLGKEE